MELTQILPLERWSEIEQGLFEKYNLQGSVFNTEGIRITKSKDWSNRLCPVIKSIEKGQSFICAVAHMNMANQAMQSKKYVIDDCDAGLLKLVVPIFFKNEYLGVIGGCGLLMDGGEVDSFAIHKIVDIDEAKVNTLSLNIPTISYKKACSICHYLEEQLNSALKIYETPLGVE